MAFLDLAKARYSVRKFKDEHISQADLDYILEAGRVAPTATNAQPHRVLVINSDEGCERLKATGASQCHAPTAILVCYDKTKCWVRRYDNADSGEVDASIVATHMMLAAAEKGVGSTWVMYFDPVKASDVLEIPENYEPVVFLMMGYPAEDCVPSASHDSRLPLDETVFIEKF